MKLTKVLALILATTMTFSLLGCGSKEAAPAAPAAEEAAPAAEEAAPAEEEATSIGSSVEGELTVTIWDEGQRPGLQQSVDEWSAQ